MDTGNAWYWRFDRRRLDAEALRDSLLALAGNLDRSTAPARTRSRRRNVDASRRTTSSRRCIRRTTGAST